MLAADVYEHVMNKNGATKLAKAMINAFSGISFYKFAKIQT